jgi:class 3 adenylate cyclase
MPRVLPAQEDRLPLQTRVVTRCTRFADGRAQGSVVDVSIVVIRQAGRTPLHLAVLEPIEVGRDCAGVLLTDLQISRRHVVLEPVEGGVTVRDLGSMNGTLVDGRRLEVAHRLVSGQSIRIGDSSIELLAPVGGGPSGVVVETDLVAAAVVDERPVMVADDGGTVTIVFSDIEDSTTRAVEMGDVGWMEVLKVHNAIVRRQVARFRGTEVKSQGDGFMLTFSSARAALEAMIEAQRALETWARSQPANAVRVRVGVHTGEAIRTGDDLFGKHVMLAARIANAAKGAEILVSSLVREIVEARGDLRFEQPRTVELKGLSGDWQVHPVIWRAGVNHR